MNHNNAIILLDRLVSSSPTELHHWLTAIDAGNTEAPECFNWLGLAQAAGHRARTDLNLEWAAIAVALYTRLAKSNSGRKRDQLLVDVMHIRAFFIKRMGSSPGHPVLDIQDLVAWFLSTLTISLAQAQRMTEHWEHLTIEEIRTLRDIKNRLAVFVNLRQDEWIEPYPELKDWLAVREQLP